VALCICLIMKWSFHFISLDLFWRQWHSMLSSLGYKDDVHWWELQQLRHKGIMILHFDFVSASWFRFGLGWVVEIPWLSFLYWTCNIFNYISYVNHQYYPCTFEQYARICHISRVDGSLAPLTCPSLVITIFICKFQIVTTIGIFAHMWKQGTSMSIKRWVFSI
jgi:hypothetical protein